MRLNGKYLILTLLIFVGISFEQKCLAVSGDIVWSYAKRLFKEVEDRSSDWDPIGKAFNPIEEAIPGLKIKGFIENESDMQLHNRDDLTQFNVPSRNFTWQKIEWLTELELRYKPQEKWGLVSIFDFLYDAAYDWDGGFRRNFQSSGNVNEFRNYKNDRILRELYLDLYFPQVDIRLGKQQVIWGKVDGRKIMDFINPEDFREGIFDTGQDDWEFSRLPLWMANFSYWTREGDWNFQFLWIPDFTESILMPPNSVWEVPTPPIPPIANVIFLPRDRPSGFFDESEVAFRIKMIKRGFDVALSYFYTTNDFPTFFKRAIIPPPLPGPPTPFNRINFFLEPTHTRLHRIGINMDKSIFAFNRQVTFKIENVFTINNYFSTAAEPFPMPGVDGVTKKDSNTLGFTIESYFKADWYWALRTDWDYIVNYTGNLRESLPPIGGKAHRNGFGIFLDIEGFVFNDRINTSSLIVYDPNDGDWVVRQKFFFTLSDYITLQIGGVFFSGNKNDLFGQFDKLDQVEFGIKYEF